MFSTGLAIPWYRVYCPRIRRASTPIRAPSSHSETRMPGGRDTRFINNLKSSDIAPLELLYRGHARAEDRTRGPDLGTDQPAIRRRIGQGRAQNDALPVLHAAAVLIDAALECFGDGQRWVGTGMIDAQ